MLSIPYRSPSAPPLAVFALAIPLAGCGVDPTEPPALENAEPVEEAFYILQRSHLYSDEWPARFERYRVFVANASLRSDDLARIRRDVPDAICLAATSCLDVRIALHEGIPYFDALTAMFPEELCVRDLIREEIVRIQETPDPNLPAVPAFVMSRDAAEALAGFHRDVTMRAGWDGLYLDRCVRAFPASRKSAISAITTSFDIDGDGAPDTGTDIDDQYERWRPYYTARLREMLGDGAILLGNSGGALEDPALNGITLERVGDRFGRDEAEHFIRAQWNVSHDPHLSILWAFSDVDFAPSVSLARDLEAFVGDLR